jgi:hypothetical protein
LFQLSVVECGYVSIVFHACNHLLGCASYLLPSVFRAGRKSHACYDLACLIALAGLVIIAAGVWDLSSLEAETGETLALSDYAPGVQTIADGLVMLGVAQALRLLLVIMTNTKPL